MTHTTIKAIKQAYHTFNYGKVYGSLLDCYTCPSEAKRRAFDECLRMYYNNGGIHAGVGYCILGYNTMQFSFGFVGIVGNKPAFFYITRDNARWAYLDELEA